ncbi:MAG: mechanosensitive ion channel family protein [Acidobacteria bacterium]|uniref:Mechanosensitive ion channel family protein n=1 Tax=Candidatus Polarisedimenticola svalbardensis TaxID=2886004 RepID=A0A8J6XV13_9BACT|nr:mechanosensitive ion channel family protein [Candidatus Polarisedimenticola svalbardensis]
MEIISEFAASLRDYVPFLFATALIAVGLWAANYVLLVRRKDLGAEAQRPRQIAMLVLTALGLFVLLLIVPMSDSTRGSVLSLIGLVLTGVIALSSTSFVSNVMAGLMLRGIKSFGAGDFIGIGEKFGRVTERGLLHTEIQTEDRSLTTFPNFYLVSNPVHVVRRSGTVISTTVSLGYDLDRVHVEKLLIQAAESAGLTDPFVRILSLGDYSVTYQICGHYLEIRRLFTARSDLQKMVFDTLHAGGLEIVSPSFMNQRQLSPESKVIPKKRRGGDEAGVLQDEAPEDLIFDKAEEAEEIERAKAVLAGLRQDLHELNKKRKDAEEAEHAGLDHKITLLEAEVRDMEATLEPAKPAEDPK